MEMHIEHTSDRIAEAGTSLLIVYNTQVERVLHVVVVS